MFETVVEKRYRNCKCDCYIQTWLTICEEFDSLNKLPWSRRCPVCWGLHLGCRRWRGVLIKWAGCHDDGSTCKWTVPSAQCVLVHQHEIVSVLVHTTMTIRNETFLWLFFPTSKFMGQFSRHRLGVPIVHHQPLWQAKKKKKKKVPPPPPPIDAHGNATICLSYRKWENIKDIWALLCRIKSDLSCWQRNF